MLAMYVIETWRRWLVGFAIVLIVERAPLDSTWSFFLTGLVFVVLAVRTYGDWSSARRVAYCACCAPAPTWRPRRGNYWS